LLKGGCRRFSATIQKVTYEKVFPQYILGVLPDIADVAARNSGDNFLAILP